MKKPTDPEPGFLGMMKGLLIDMRLLFVLTLLMCCLSVGFAQCFGEQPELERLKERFRQFLLQGESNPPLLGFSAEGWREYDHTERSPLVRRWIATLGSDGQWPDFDYANQRRSDWPLKSHTARTAAMAIEYARDGGQFAGDPSLLEAIVSSYDFWTVQDIQCSNWYPNQITVPGNIAVVLLFLEDRLTQEQVFRGLEIVKRARASGTGANLAETAMNQIAYGCLAGDPELVGKTYEQLVADLLNLNREGVKEDASFQFHGKQLYSGGYGAVYTRSMGRLTYLAEGTQFALPEEAKAILDAHVLDGQRWMVYGGNFDYGTMGRAITIPDPERRLNQHLIPGLKALARCPGPRQGEFQEFLSNLQTSSDPIEGNRFYWQSDYLVHRRKGFYYSIRMCSNRTHNAETCNSEGLMTHRTADGMTLTMVTGHEYDAIFPVWDWKRLPGVTGEYGPAPLEGNPRRATSTWFSGGVSDGWNGAAAMDFQRDGVRAKKSWFCLDDLVICLGSDISGPTDEPTITCINQALSDGETMAGEIPSVSGFLRLDEPVPVVHGGIGYWVSDGDSVCLNVGIQRGSWSPINRNQPDTEIAEDVFSLWIDHGVGSTDDAYTYYVLPGTSVGSSAELMVPGGVRIVERSSAIHAVQDARAGLHQIVFWEPGRFQDPETGLVVTVDKSCLLMTRTKGEKSELTVARPGRIQEGEDNTFTVGSNRELEGSRHDAATDLYVLEVELPILGYSGKPVTH